VSRTTFGLCTTVTGYLTYRSLRPPTPPKVDAASSRIIDAISFHHSYTLLAAYRSGLLALILLQASLISSATTSLPIIGPLRLSNLNSTLLTWNWTSAAVLGVIDVCAAIRLYAMGELAHNFTFELREPDRLNTSGLYAYVQHPSYSSGIVVFGTSASWFIRGDGVLGVILPVLGSWGEWGLRTQWFWNYALNALIWTAICLGARRRIVDEERMLKRAFGKEWEEWHARTARLIPGLF
jgi:protein-S-isoprenylcysteine O-methyltransferase Ste14